MPPREIEDEDVTRSLGRTAVFDEHLRTLGIPGGNTSLPLMVSFARPVKPERLIETRALSMDVPPAQTSTVTRQSSSQASACTVLPSSHSWVCIAQVMPLHDETLQGRRSSWA